MNKQSIHKILVANRGEIALRIIKAIHDSGKVAVAIYSEADKALPYVNAAGSACSIGMGTLRETYLNQQLIIDTALRADAEAIHPGYGFLAENAEFAKLCKENGIIFIGPEPEVIDLMGNKSNARETAKRFQVPVIEGITGSTKEILQQAATLHYPVLIKPAAGGGGKGMHIVKNQDSLKEALEDAEREAVNYFGSAELYVERYIEKARHIEVQVIADHYGNAIHLYERECTLQRRYQKIIEEAPSASISEVTRRNITGSALKLVKGINYTNAGTIEFLVDRDEAFFFIEMNTRIQVEHPVTEMITGLDIVSEQIRIAEGYPLSVGQKDISINGHSIEARIYAEDPGAEFMPSTGIIRKLDSGLSLARIDGGYLSGNEITPYYDPMIAKVIVHGDSRKAAIKKLSEAIINFHVTGVRTNRTFLLSLLNATEFINNDVHTKYIDQNLDTLLALTEEDDPVRQDDLLASIALIALSKRYPAHRDDSVWQEIGYWRMIPEIKLEHEGTTHAIKYRVGPGGIYLLNIDGREKEGVIIKKEGSNFLLRVNNSMVNCWADVDQSVITIDLLQKTFSARRTDIPDPRFNGTVKKGSELNIKDITAPLNGKVVKINVKENQSVKQGDPLLLIESMKMENKITAPGDGEIAAIHVSVGELVEQNMLLITLK